MASEPEDNKKEKTLYSMMLERAPQLPTTPGIYLAADGNPFGDGDVFDPVIIIVDELLRVTVAWDDGSNSSYPPEDPDSLRWCLAEIRPLSIEAFRAAWAELLRADKGGES